MRCDKCKHWNREDSPNYQEDYYNTIDTNLCNKTVVLWNATEWAKAEDGVSGLKIKDEYKDQLMFTKDGSDYWASLYTKANFFCAHFEE